MQGIQSGKKNHLFPGENNNSLERSVILLNDQTGVIHARPGNEEAILFFFCVLFLGCYSNSQKIARMP